MKIHEQRDELAKAIQLALPYLGGGPTLSAFGIAREDCALVHMDYFGGIQSVASVLANALAEVRGTTAADIYREFGSPPTPCDCKSCIGKEAAADAREKYRAAYTNVKEWRQ